LQRKETLIFMKEIKPVFGIHPVIEALKSAENIDKVIIAKDFRADIRKEILKLATDRNVPVQFVPAEKMKRLIPNGNHQGIAAVIAPIAFSEIEHLVPWWFENGIDPLVLILDEVTDVRNFGAIARTAECAGVSAILIPWKNAAGINELAVRTSAGALYNIPLCRTKNLVSSVKFLKQSGFQVVSCTEKAEMFHAESELTSPLAIVLGSEEYGISADILKVSDMLIKIPMFGEVQSLNVSVAAGVVLYEAVRQKMKNSNQKT
jgi:23S rRNA (guanosine2251-2'-O)-methyltransferase